MAKFDKKWSELSGDESRKMKKKFGSRKAWQEAKGKAQARQSQQSQTTQPANATPQTTSAPQSSGSGASTSNAQALNNEHTPNANDVGAQNKPAETQSRYGANADWDNMAKGGVRDEVRNDPRLQEMVKDPHTGEMKNKYAIGYKKGNIIKNPAVHNLDAMKRAQQMQAKTEGERAQKSAKYDARQVKRDEARAYGEGIAAIQEFKKANNLSLERHVDQSAHYRHLMKTKGHYGGSKHKYDAIERLLQTGEKFGHLDVERELGSESDHLQEGLYQAYGGRENYMKNHSVDSGNFKGNENLGTMKEADQKQRDYFAEISGFYNSDEFQSKYGGYDWAQKTIQNHNRQAAKWVPYLQRREQRMSNSDNGHVYGF